MPFEFIKDSKTVALGKLLKALTKTQYFSQEPLIFFETTLSIVLTLFRYGDFLVSYDFFLFHTTYDPLNVFYYIKFPAHSFPVASF